jgi:hypothetical protein
MDSCAAVGAASVVVVLAIDDSEWRRRSFFWLRLRLLDSLADTDIEDISSDLPAFAERHTEGALNSAGSGPRSVIGFTTRMFHR